MTDDTLETISLTEMIRLRERLSETLARRFGRTAALAATALVPDGTGPAGAAEKIVWRPRHRALAEDVYGRVGGFVVGGGADGVVAVTPTVDAAVGATVELMRRFVRARAGEAPAGLALAAGVCWGPALTDGKIIDGEAAALARRVAERGQPTDIRLVRAAYAELSSRFRLRCSALTPPPGEPWPLELYRLSWLDQTQAPAYVRVEETGEIIALPDKPVVAFGRLSGEGNDIVLSLPDREAMKHISRWRHFELRRELDELYFHSLSEQPAVIDGQAIPKGERARLAPGTIVRVAGAVSLLFLADPTLGHDSDETALQTMAVTPSNLKP